MRWVLVLVLCAGCAIAHIRPQGDVDCFVMGNARCERTADGTVHVDGVVAETTWAGVVSGLITAGGAAFAVYLVH